MLDDAVVSLGAGNAGVGAPKALATKRPIAINRIFTSGLLSVDIRMTLILSIAKTPSTFELLTQ